MFSPGWSSLLHWNDSAATFDVTSTAPPTTTTHDGADHDDDHDRRPTTTTAPTDHDHDDAPTTTTTTAPPTTTTAPPSGGRFETLPVGATLPTEAQCAARVRPAAEIRPQNATFNATTGARPHAEKPRVTGNFTGTTDEILQWAACKWGIDEDLVRAQIARESWWKHDSRGDLT